MSDSNNKNIFDKNRTERLQADPARVLAWENAGREGPDPLGPRPPGYNWWFDYRKNMWTETKRTDSWYVRD